MKTKFLSLLTILMAVNVMPVFSAPKYYETVSGTVTDENNNAVETVAVSVIYDNNQSANNLSMTDKDGNFTLKKVPSDTYLLLTLVGYKTEKIPVSAEHMNISLKRTSDFNVEEVVIKGDKSCNNLVGAVWSKTENKCVCKKKHQKLDGQECVDICSSDAGLKWDEKTKTCVCERTDQEIKGDKCVDKCSSADGLKWDKKKGTCVCRDKNKDLKDNKCVDKEKPAESVPPASKPTDTRSDEQKAKDMQEKQTAYETARDTEQSRENRLLTAATTAATGIGGMELAQGLAEQRADKTAEQSMTNYIATMRCKYGDTQVKAGLEEIELPGGNNSEMAKYRTEYFALATDLKERKTALGMAPGIENEEILDKSKMGLYTQENIGINDGAYASLYRAQMYNSESDKAKINEAKESSENRVTIGATAAGIGVVGGIIGDRLINNEATERIARASKNSKAAENTALNKLKSCLAQAGVNKTNKLSFKEFKASALNLDGINCETDLSKAKGKNAQDLFEDSADGTKVCAKLKESFGENIAQKILGCPNNQLNTIISGDSGNGVDLSSKTSINGTLIRAVHNKVCEVSADEPQAPLISQQDTTKCAGLVSGEWDVKFNYGTIKGTTMCASTSGQQYEIGTPTGSGNNCWCRATALDSKSSIKSNWVSFPNNDADCSLNCARACAQNVQKNSTLREALFGTSSSVDTTDILDVIINPLSENMG